MKKLLGVALAVWLVLVAGVLFNALGSQPRPRSGERPPVDPAVDAHRVAEHLAASLRFKTISHEDPAHDDRSVFAAFRAFLETTYPRVHATLARELVNGDGLVFHWRGSEPSLPPVLFLAHQDVVPIEPGTEARWTHPPFAGVIADGHVWGRGAIDDKGSLICLFEAFESLLGQGFRPARSVWLASGFDEEVGGALGAKQISALFAQRNVRFAWLLDEGGGVTEGIVPDVDRPVASIAIAEKGYLSVELLAQGTGGHSSMPPRDSAVVALTRALTQLEKRPFPPRLTPTLRQSIARLAPEMPFARRLVSANLWLTGPLVLHTLAEGERTSPQVRTTMAPTILEAGVKDNVVPSTARAVVNLRIVPGETVESAFAHVRGAIVDKHVQIRQLQRTVSNPAPLSRTDGPGFRALEKVIGTYFPDAVVIPNVVNGATDARHFVGVADDQYRFVPRVSRKEDLKRVHGTDERASVEGLGVMVSAYRDLIRLGASR